MNIPRGSEATLLLKRELRKRIRAALAALPPSSIETESNKLCDRFLRSQAYQNASSIALYASMPQELNTKKILSQAFDDSKRVFLPRVVSKQDHRMLMLECNSMTELLSWTPNSWNIREPPLEESRAQSPRDASLDLVLVPGVAFDVLGARCGRGMGFYDRFLASYAVSSYPMPYLVALALSVQMVQCVPVSETDWKMDESDALEDIRTCKDKCQQSEYGSSKIVPKHDLQQCDSTAAGFLSHLRFEPEEHR